MTSDPPRIPTHVWLMAALRQIEAAGGAYYVTQRGEGQSGIVIAKIRNNMGVFTLYTQGRNVDGVMGWLPVRPKGQTTQGVEESWADAYIARAAARDPDLWAVEIETRTDEFPLEGPVFNDLG